MNVLSGTEDRPSRLLAGPVSESAAAALSFRPPVAPRYVSTTLQRIFFPLHVNAAAIKPARAAFAQPLALHLPRVDPTVSDPRPPRRGARAALRRSRPTRLRRVRRFAPFPARP